MAGPDMSVVVGAIDFGSVLTAVVGVFASLVVVFMVVKGAKMVLMAVGGGDLGGGKVWGAGWSEEEKRAHYERLWAYEDERERVEFVELQEMANESRFNRVRQEMENGSTSDADWDWIWSDEAKRYREG